MTTPAIQTEALWNDLHDRLRDFVRRRIGSEHDADDVLQEIFVRIHERLTSLRDPAGVVAWVFTIARNAVTDYYRSRARRQDVEHPGAAPGAETLGVPLAPDEIDEDTSAELSRCMRPFVDQLHPEYRRAVLLVDFDGLTHQQTADRLGLSVSGAKSRVQRGRRMVRDLLLECCEVELDRRQGVVGYARRSGGSCGGCGCGPESP